MPNGLEGVELDKALKKIKTRDLTVMTFKTMNDHIISCTKSSERVERAVKYVGGLVLALALEKIFEIVPIGHLIHMATP